MLIKSGVLERRKFLKGILGGAAVTVGLPFLDCFLDNGGAALAATGQKIPVRFGTWFWGLGMNSQVFIPKKIGADYDIPIQLKPIEAVKQHVNVFSNFQVLTDGKPGLDHFSGWVALRCGNAPAGRNDLASASLDVAVAEAIGQTTRFRALDCNATGNPRDSYSFRSADAINLPEVSPLEFYQKIFGTDFQDPNSDKFTPDPRIMLRKSVLSGILERSNDFSRGLGASDKARLDEYYTSIRQLEQRLDLQLEKPPAAPACKVPSAPKEVGMGTDAELVRHRHRLMTDLLVMAVACDQSRVFNMTYSNSGSTITRKGEPLPHHNLTHEEPVDSELGYQKNTSWFVEQALTEWAYFVQALASIKEGSGTLLDNSLVYAHSDQEYAKTHSLNGIPMFTAGRAGGKMKTGIHVNGEGTAGTRLGYTVQKVMGVPISSWGTQSMETSKELGAILS